MSWLSVESVTRRVRHIWVSIPKKRFLLAAALLVGLNLVITWAGGLGAVQRLCDKILADLGAFRPFAMAGDFFGRYLACDTKHVEKLMNGVDYGLDVTTCEAIRYVSPLRNGVLFWEIIRDNFAILSLPGKMIMAVALLVSFTWTALALSAIWESIFRRKLFLPVTLLTAAILTPAIAGLVVFILQWFAIVLFTLFGAVIGLFIWMGSVLGLLVGAWRFIRDVESASKHLEGAAGAAGVLTATLAKPGDKPKVDPNSG